MVHGTTARRNSFPNANRDRSYEAELAQESAERMWSLAQKYATNPAENVFDAIYFEAQTLRARVGELVAENISLRNQNPFR